MSPTRPTIPTELTKALLAIQRGDRLDQATVLRLRDGGLIEVAEVTHMQSRGREYIPTVLTSKGLGLLDGSIEKHAVEVKELRETVGLSAIRETRMVRQAGKEWDVFISHACEDKEEIAQPLAEALKGRGYQVWYDDFSLKLGDSLRESINQGLANSRFGVVILSKHFFAKHWPNQELNGLTAFEVGGEKVILPVWHGVTHSDVVKYSPPLADRKAVSTIDGLEKVIAEIAAVLSPPLTRDSQDQLRLAKEELQDYRCPYCGSPLSTRSGVQLGEHYDGTFESFECGFSQIDGHMRQPCPSDPRFPTLNEYEFICREIENDLTWKWSCTAIGKTGYSQALTLMQGLGRTKEEARQKVEDSYRGYAKPWRD
jgi:TIR domain